jgi:uroporphyrinogen-III decarboxylase
MDFVVELGISFGLAQVDAGAEAIGIGDAAASLIGPALYDEFVWPGEQRLVNAMHDAGVICRLHICGNNRRFLPHAAKLGCEIIDIDAPVTMVAARQAVGAEQVICGNLDPVRSIHDGTPDEIFAKFGACHDQAGPRYIVGGGCEIPRRTALPNFQAIVDFARTTSGG